MDTNYQQQQNSGLLDQQSFIIKSQQQVQQNNQQGANQHSNQQQDKQLQIQQQKLQKKNYTQIQQQQISTSSLTVSAAQSLNSSINSSFSSVLSQSFQQQQQNQSNVNQQQQQIQFSQQQLPQFQQATIQQQIPYQQQDGIIFKDSTNTLRNNKNTAINNNFPKSEPSSINSSLEKKKLSEEEWLKIEAPQKLIDSLKKLQLSHQKMNKKTLSEMSSEVLNQEKKKIKAELKSYDEAFKQIFGKPPTRGQKEPMRPLYVYYKDIKLIISKQSTCSQNTTQNDSFELITNQAGPTNSNNIINNLGLLKRGDNVNEKKQTTIGQVSSSASNSLDLAIVKSQNYMSIDSNQQILQKSIPQQIQGQQQVSNLQQQQQLQNQQQQSKTESLLKRNDLIDFVSNRDTIKQSHDIKSKKNTQNNSSIQSQQSQQQLNNPSTATFTKEEIVEKIQKLKRVRANLREKLQQYQDEFSRSHNRRIKFQKDIQPVEQEFREYKEIKKKINELEQILNQ